MKYQSKGSERVTGNPWSDATTITFSGSGDLDNGMTINYGYTMANAVFSSSKLALDMGDTGTVSFGNVSHQAGISKYSDKMPTAGEQVWDDSDADDNGIPLHDNDNMLGYNYSNGNLGVSVAYVNGGGFPFESFEEICLLRLLLIIIENDFSLFDEIVHFPYSSTKIRKIIILVLFLMIIFVFVEPQRIEFSFIQIVLACFMRYEETFSNWITEQ